MKDIGKTYDTDSEAGSLNNLRKLKVAIRKDNKLVANEVYKLGSFEIQNFNPQIGIAEVTIKTIPPDIN
ncbi:hypothetical protein [Leptospira levettii]|uniref:hypothetical protein n=1 Tax=Leptospira levettii TaxID=2023178 RepID=UPI00311AAF18